MLTLAVRPWKTVSAFLLVLGLTAGCKAQGGATSPPSAKDPTEKPLAQPANPAPVQAVVAGLPQTAPATEKASPAQANLASTPAPVAPSNTPKAPDQPPKTPNQPAPAVAATAPAGAPVSAAAAAPPGAPSLKPDAAKRVYKPVPPPANFSPPGIHIDQPEYDWGSALQGELIKHSFVVSNSGGSPLTITQVKPSCGCTMASKPEKPIEPGQTGLVTLEIDTKRFTGPIKKTADVTSNATQAPLRLTMGGKVDPFFTIEPNAPKIDLVRGAPLEPLKITLRRSAQASFKITEVKTESKVISATFSEVQPGELYEVIVKADLKEDPRKYYYEQVDAKVAVGPQKAELGPGVAETAKVFDIPIRVSITVKDRIDVQPRPSVYFSRNDTKQLKDAPTTPISKPLDITSLAGADHTFKITKIDSDASFFDTKIETVQEGKQYRLLVLMSKFPDDTKTKTLRQKIVLHTDDPTVKELIITALAALQ